MYWWGSMWKWITGASEGKMLLSRECRFLIENCMMVATWYENAPSESCKSWISRTTKMNHGPDPIETQGGDAS